LYCGDGATNGSEACDDGVNGDDTDGCNDSCLISTNGVCGTANGTDIYDLDDGGDALTIGSSDLCGTGSASSFVFDGTLHTWSWACDGANG